MFEQPDGCLATGIHEGPGPAPAASPALTWYASRKEAMDVVLGLLLLVLTAPVLLVAALAVRLTSRGPAIYSQVRLGLDGRAYTIYKLRTMAHNCEAGTGAVWAVPRDPRITPLGRFLRVSHIDELPQLWNVLRGEMSLVGPRPERPEIASTLEMAIPGYRERVRIRPGVTGLAQVQLPPDTDLNSVRRKLACDLYYIRRAGPGLDLRILLGTALGVLGMPFAVTRSLLRLPGTAEVESDGRGTLAEVDGEGASPMGLVAEPGAIPSMNPA